MVTDKDREEAKALWTALTVQYGDSIESGAKEIARIREESAKEARELIKEMREVMKLNRDRLAVLGYASETIDAVLAKSKDYA